VLVLLGVCLGGVDHQPAGAAPRETPARKITRLRAKAARVQAAIDRMHARVEALVEDYNEVHEALARTRAEQARTRRQVLEARRRLWVARRVLGKRLWVIYTGGAPSTLGQLLAADSVHQALVTTKYQEQVVGADRAALDQVERLRRQVEALAARVAGQAERQERLRARLVAKRRQIESRLDAQRHYLKRLTRQVRKAVLRERRRQERLRRLALLRRLAAERAARARAAAAARAGGSRARFGGAGAPSGAAGRAVAFARSQLGKPYVWGASGPSSYDCSGLIMAAYRSAGVWLPGQPGPVRRRPPGRPWQPRPRRPGVLRLQHREPGVHPPRRYVYRRWRDGRSSLFRGQGPHRLHRPRDYIGAVRPTG